MADFDKITVKCPVTKTFFTLNQVDTRTWVSADNPGDACQLIDSRPTGYNWPLYVMEPDGLAVAGRTIFFFNNPYYAVIYPGINTDGNFLSYIDNNGIRTVLTLATGGKIAAVSACVQYYSLSPSNQLYYYSDPTFNMSAICTSSFSTGTLYVANSNGVPNIGDTIYSSQAGGITNSGYYSYVNTSGIRVWLRTAIRNVGGIGSGTIETYVAEMGSCQLSNNNISVSNDGYYVYFNSSSPVASVVNIDFYWQDENGAVGNGLVSINVGNNNVSTSTPTGSPFSTVLITAVSPSSDSSYNYTF